MDVKISQLKPFVGSLNRLIVEPFPVEETRKSGLIDTSKLHEKPAFGTVIKISEQDQNGIKPTLKETDVIMFGKQGHTTLTIEGKEYLVMTENDVYSQIVK